MKFAGGLKITDHQLAFTMLVVETNLRGNLFTDTNSSEGRQGREVEYYRLLRLVQTWQLPDKTIYPLSSRQAAVQRNSGPQGRNRAQHGLRLERRVRVDG